MFKEIEVPFLTPLDEPSIQIVRPGFREKFANVKIGNQIYKELEDFKGKPGKSYMLVVAVSPTEYWGPNKNNDGFSEYWLKKNHPTFTTHGTFYKNHVNKDPKNNYGDNELSWYDDQMKRVVVLVGVDHKKAPDIVQDLESGKRLSVSMGCRIAHDVCSICGNKAPTRSDYCDHMKYHAGEIFPDGRRVYVDNPGPTFFDLSKVIRPAGHIEYIIKVVKPKGQERDGDQEKIEVTQKEGSYMQKAAEMNGDTVTDPKIADLNKICDMIKIVRGESVSSDEMDPKLQQIVKDSKSILSPPEDIDDSTLEDLSKFPLPKILGTANLMGIQFKVPEMIKMVLSRLGMPEIDDLLGSLDEVGFNPCDCLESSSPAEYLQSKPKVLKVIIEKKTLGDNSDADEKVASLLEPYFESRSMYPPLLERRAFLPKKNVTKQARALDLHNVYDSSGREYLTTQEAIDRAGETNAFKNMMKGIGLGTALTGASLAAHKIPIIGGKYLLPAAWAGTLWGAKKFNDNVLQEPVLTTVPSNIVLQKMGSLIDRYDREKFEKEASSSFMEKVRRVFNDDPLPPAPAPSRTYDYAKDAWGWATRNPELATIGSLFAAGMGLKGIDRIGKTISGAGKGLSGMAGKAKATASGLGSDSYLQRLRRIYETGYK